MNNKGKDRDKSLRSGERQVYDILPGIEYWHRWRYQKAVPYVSAKTVLDVGCGVGYGSVIMSRTAKHITAIDDSAEAIEYARQRWFAKNIDYCCVDFLSMNSFDVDVIVAYEFIEHVEDTKAVFEKFKSFNPSLIIVSVPHRRCPIGENKFHFRHYGMDELIDSFFDIGFKPLEAKLVYFNNCLDNFIIAERK